MKLILNIKFSFYSFFTLLFNSKAFKQKKILYGAMLISIIGISTSSCGPIRTCYKPMPVEPIETNSEDTTKTND